MHTLEDAIREAHHLVAQLLTTEVTAFDIELALEHCCRGWSDEMTAVTLRIAAEFSKVQSDAFLCAAEFSPDDTRAMQEHILYVGYRLGEHLDLPVDYVWTDED